MRCISQGKPLLLAFLLVGCASTPKILPRNEINEPVFHQTDFIALGANGGRTLTRPEEGDAFDDGIYFNPEFIYENKVSNWASYSLLPVFWNLLLTGEQYSDSANLVVRKLNLAFHGGIKGIFYSSRDGWESTGLLSLEGKYLIHRNWFLGATLETGLDDLGSLNQRFDRLSFGVGAQVSDRNSLKLTYSLTRFDLPRNLAYNFDGILHIDGDTRTVVELRHAYYGWRKHVFGPEFGFAYRNYSISKAMQFAVGVHYAYMFD